MPPPRSDAGAGGRPPPRGSDQRPFISRYVNCLEFGGGAGCSPSVPGRLTMGLILLVILLVLLLGSVPAYPYSRRWGYGPSGLVGTLLIVLLVLMLMGTVPWGWGRR